MESVLPNAVYIVSSALCIQLNIYFFHEKLSGGLQFISTSIRKQVHVETMWKMLNQVCANYGPETLFNLAPELDETV